MLPLLKARTPARSLPLSSTTGKFHTTNDKIRENLTVSNSQNYDTTNAIVRLLGRLTPEAGVYNVEDPISSTLVDHWLDFAESKLATSDFKQLDAAYKELNKYLTLRSYLVGYQPSLADFVVWGALRGMRDYVYRCS